MALTFTNDQIKELTQKILDAPTTIASLEADKANLIAQKAQYLATDNTNAVYTNNWLNIISQYHTELKNLNGVSKTNYDTANIQSSGQLADGNIHFPMAAPVWVNFQPKKHASNEGEPVGTYANNENDAIPVANDAISLMKSGFSSGSATTTTKGAFTTDTVSVTSAVGFAVGDKVLFTSGSNFLYGTITSIGVAVPLTGTPMQVSIIFSSSSYAGIAIGATVKNSFSGFTLSQRNSGSGSNAGETALLLALEGDIDTKVGLVKTALDAQKVALLANDATGAEAAEITATKTTLDTRISSVATWQGYPQTGSTSRFGNNLSEIETLLSTRLTEIPARATQITTRLGSITQNPDGTYSGDGNYFNLFSSLDVRLNKGGGTLRSYYNSDLGIALFTNMIVSFQNQVDRDSAAFTVKALGANANGTNQITVTDSTGLTAGPAKVMSSTQPVIDVNIASIFGSTLTLDVTVSSDYKAAESARIVKQI